MDARSSEIVMIRWKILCKIGCQEIFSPVVRLTTSKVVLAMCDVFDLHIE